MSSGTLAGQHATFGIQSNAAVAIHRDVHVKHFVRFSLEVQRSISHERVSAYTGWGLRGALSATKTTDDNLGRNPAAAASGWYEMA